MAKKKRTTHRRKKLSADILKPEPPILASRVVREIESRPAVKKAVPVKASIRLPLQFAKGGRKGLQLFRTKGKATASAELASELVVTVPGKLVGRHTFPPKPTTKRLVIPRKEKYSKDVIASLASMAPAHLALHAKPLKLPKSLRAAPMSLLHDCKLKRGEKMPTTLFPPEDRLAYFDTSYPWGTVGRLSTGASGVMIGPRHMLTVSHGIPWSGSGVSAFTFTPGTFDGSAPFGVANATRVYFYVKVTGTLDQNERRHDYAVVVLNWNIGNLTGWMGSRPDL